MNWLVALFILLLLPFSVWADCLFVNLNGQEAEWKACQAGMKGDDRLHVVNGVPGKDDETGYSNTYKEVRATIAKALSEGREIDCIVISGDHGSGRFFHDLGFFTSEDFRALRDDFPGFRVSSAALWGCYTTTVKSCDAHWIQNLEGMNFVMGFDGQAPVWSAQAGQQYLQAYCATRKDIAGRISKKELCEFRDNIAAMVGTVTHLGFCSKETVASEYYGCKTYQELQAMCPNFVNNRPLQDVYDHYDAGTVEAPTGADQDSKDYSADYAQFSPQLRENTCRRGDVHPLRCYYNHLHYWQHCERGNDMPDIRETLSLIKYKQIKSRAQKNNQVALQSFDGKLREFGLGDYALGDITEWNRQELNERIKTARQKILEMPANDSATRKVRATLHRMSQCLDQTLNHLKNSCIPDEWHVTKEIPAASPCLETYEASEKGANEACKVN